MARSMLALISVFSELSNCWKCSAKTYACTCERGCCIGWLLAAQRPCIAVSRPYNTHEWRKRVWSAALLPSACTVAVHSLVVSTNGTHCYNEAKLTHPSLGKVRDRQGVVNLIECLIKQGAVFVCAVLLLILVICLMV